MRWPTRAWGQRKAKQIVPLDDSSLWAGYNMRPTDNDVLADQSVNGYDLTRNAGPISSQSVLGPAMDFNGSGSWVSTAPNDTLTSVTVELWWYPYATGDDADRVLTLSTPGTELLYFSGGTRLYVRNGIVLVYAQDDSIPINQWHHVVFTYTNGVGGTFYLDGAPTAAPTIAYNINIPTVGDISLGGTSTNTLNSSGRMTKPIVYNEVKDATWIANRYREGAIAAHYDSLWGAIESVAAEGGTIGQYLSNTGYQFVDATTRWRVGSDLVIGGAVAAEPYKSVYPTVGGYIYQDNIELGLSTAEMLYGTWKFSMYKNGAGDEVNYVMGSSATGAVFNGYYVQFDASERLRLYERTGAAAATVLGTAAAALDLQTWYDVYVTRTYAGLWRLYYKEATSPTWIQVGDGATDTTHLTATYRQLGASANSRIGWATRSGNHSMTQLLGVVAP